MGELLMGHKKKVMVSAFLFFFFILTFLFINKKIRPNLILADRYEVRGVDVSHYQGDIDWEKMAAENIDFAYIKATEGSRYVDERFLSLIHI